MIAHRTNSIPLHAGLLFCFFFTKTWNWFCVEFVMPPLFCYFRCKCRKEIISNSDSVLRGQSVENIDLLSFKPTHGKNVTTNLAVSSFYQCSSHPLGNIPLRLSSPSSSVSGPRGVFHIQTHPLTLRLLLLLLLTCHGITTTAVVVDVSEIRRE